MISIVAAFAGVCGCAHELEGPTPTLEGQLEPHLVCNELAPMTTVGVAGANLVALPVDTAMGPAQLVLPSIELTRTLDLEGGAVSDEPLVLADDPPDESSVRWHSQSRMTFDVTPDLGLDDGVWDLVVTNPDGQSVTILAALAVVPPPSLDTVTPDSICIDESDVTLTISGSGFLVVDGVLPTITVVGAAEDHVYDPTEFGDCFGLPAPATEAQSCATLTFVIPQGDLTPGSYHIVVTNPDPAGCSSSTALTIEVVPPPTLDDVDPNLVCTSGGTIGLQGTGFRAGATVEAGVLTADSVDVDPSGETATAVFGSGLAVGRYDVTFTNADGCSDTLIDAIEVIQGPVIFWVDPPVVYDGISTQITIFGSGLSTEVEMVEIVPAGGGEALELEFALDAVAGRIQAVVPAGTPPGEYDVRVTDRICPSTLEGGLTVTDTLALTIDQVVPPFGWTERNTALSIFGAGFAATPRAYLNPENPTAETVATTLNAVAFVDAGRLTAVAQSGLPAGVYDLFVVNPNGEVGLLEAAFTITADPPPQIDEISPGEVDNGDVQDIGVTGSGFDDPTATWVCRAPDGSTSEPAGSITTWDEGTADVTLDATVLSAGTVCVLRMTNASGAFGEYSAVAITNPSSNIRPFRDGTNTVTGRRGLSLVGGRATRSARFLYALGGDDGSTAGAFDSSESAAVDIFGDLGAWFEQPNGLPGPRTLVGARTIGRFIYLVGGDDGTSAVDDVWRAEILDPIESPQVEDILVRQNEGAGLGSGVWIYRVAAVFPADHPTNPGGEGLPSDPLVINLPESLADTLIVTIFWSPVDGAESYRIYRSPVADTAWGGERLLTEIPATAAREFEDDASLTTSEASPLPLGAHGTWTELPPMSTARAGHGMGLARDPADPSRHYLYVLGGVDETGAALDSVEFLAIDVVSPAEQTPGASWTAVTEGMSLARTQLGVYTVDHFAASRVSEGTTFLYAISGFDAAGDVVSDAEVAVVLVGGQLGPFLEVQSARRQAGFAHVAASNFLYLMGGGPDATGSTFSAEICSPAHPCDPPELRNWNNEGPASLDPPRYLPGSTLESAFIFVVGGVDASGAVLRSTTQTVW